VKFVLAFLVFCGMAMAQVDTIPGAAATATSLCPAGNAGPNCSIQTDGSNNVALAGTLAITKTITSGGVAVPVAPTITYTPGDIACAHAADNTLAAATYAITNTGAGYTAVSTTATLGNGSATCSGTDTISMAALAGAQGYALQQGALVTRWN
jgi:hypothetical protein